MTVLSRSLVALVAVLGACPLAAQSDGIDLTVNHVGIGIGDVRRVTGIRLNFRDRRDFDVVGINATVWAPYRDVHGTITGLALGLPLVGATKIDGVAVGIFGASAEEDLRGIGVGGLGLGAGGNLEGIMIGGLGAGTGGDVKGIAIGGLGVGGGGDVTGLVVGGLGAGTGGRLKGVAIGGLGVGGGGDVTGIAIGGVGVGSGGDVRGLTVGGIGVGGGGSVSGITIGGIGVGTGGRLSGLSIGGVGVGAGGTVRGINIAGIAIGAGESLRWVSIAGVGIGSPRVVGFAAAPAVGGQDISALVLAPAYMRVEHGEFRGVSVSAFNHVKGDQVGVTIGVFNYATYLSGLQIGVLNYVRTNPAPFKLLPIVNFHVDKR
jgi:hypothetical protein